MCAFGGAGGTPAIGDRGGRASVLAGGCPWSGSRGRLQKGPFLHRASAWGLADGGIAQSVLQNAVADSMRRLAWRSWVSQRAKRRSAWSV